jgi:glycerophosphoryl diester phosphodiesterase
VLFAHRGGSHLWPENTAPGFVGCQQLGPLVIETDLRVTRDGHLVLFHDDTLDRTTNGHGKIDDKTLRQLLQLDAGYWFTRDGVEYPFRGRNLRILTLDELAELLPAASFNLELKPGHPDTPELLWKFFQRTRRHDRFLVAGADHKLISDFRSLAGSHVATSASRREAMEFYGLFKTELMGWLKPKYQALQVPTHAFGGRLVTPTFLQAAHGHGLDVHAWTVNEPSQMAELLAIGVDGIMSDRPDLLLEAANNAARRPA